MGFVHKAESSPHTTPSPIHSTPKRISSRSSTLLFCIALIACIYYFYPIFKTCNIMQPSEPDLSTFTDTIFLPFTNNFSPKDVTRIRCTIEGEVFHNMPLDTGSTGTLIGAPILPHLDPKTGIPAHHFFTSSRILYVGRLIDLQITFHANAGSIATAQVPVLIVDKSFLCPWYSPGSDGSECPPGPNGESPTERDTAKIAYMGVGFGRNRPSDGMPFASPRINPFLNIKMIDGQPVSETSMRCGYIVAKEGVHIGLTRENTRDFAFSDLQPGLTNKQDAKDWSMAAMCFRIDGGDIHCGTVLVDTGVSQMYIRPEVGGSIPNVTVPNPIKHGYAKMVRRVKPGTEITVASPSFDFPVAAYSFTVGEGSNIEPEFVVPALPSSPPYVNTGRNFLHGYSIAFDAVGGRFGFCPVRSSSSSVL